MHKTRSSLTTRTGNWLRVVAEGKSIRARCLSSAAAAAAALHIHRTYTLAAAAATRQ